MDFRSPYYHKHNHNRSFWSRFGEGDERKFVPDLAEDGRWDLDSAIKKFFMSDTEPLTIHMLMCRSRPKKKPQEGGDKTNEPQEGGD